ncbi:MAG: GMC family oxidoreductase [Candidatus Paracaedibacteraceae bacterium]|nr:GMC family oxidoreductase [Candidatus Paracaedibacteraceae bacterium]
MKDNSLHRNSLYILFSITFLFNWSGCSAQEQNSQDGYDYIIVGAGAAGSTLAGTLLANTNENTKILLIEAGVDGTKDPMVTNYVKSGYLMRTKYDWSDVTAPQVHLNGRTVLFNGGKVNGGGSSINGMLWARGHKGDYDSWIPQGQESNSDWQRWKGEKILPLFEYFEHFQGFSKEREPAEAWTAAEFKIPSRVLTREIRYPLADDFIRVAHRNGYPHNEQYVRDLRQGVSYPTFNIFIQPGKEDADIFEKYGRCDAFSCFVSTQHETTRQRLTLKNSTRVFEILYDKEKPDGEMTQATGVMAFDENNKQTETFHLKPYTGQLILSAGALRTPQILMLSGIGNSEVLNPVGIKVKRTLVKVGADLQDHVSTAIVRKLNNDKLKESQKSFTQTTRSESKQPVEKLFIEKLDAHPATLSESEIEVRSACQHLILKTPEHLNTTAITLYFEPGIKEEVKSDINKAKIRPSFQLQSNFARIAKPHPASINEQALDSIEDYVNYFGIAVINLRPFSRGSIKLTSASFLDAPRIDPHYLSDVRDVRAQLKALKEARELLEQFARDSSGWVEDEVFPGAQLITDKQLRNYIREYSSSYAHPCGTCKMGISKEYSVVGPNLKVWGFENLSIADASVMPTLPSANTNASAIMIGIQCAASLLRDRTTASSPINE